MISRELLFISRLSSYTVKATAIRVLLVSATGFLFLFFASTIVEELHLSIPAVIYARVILKFIIISEANILLDNLAERFLPIPGRISARFFLHILVSITIAWFAFIYFEKLLGPDLLKDRMVRLMMALALIFVLITIIASIAIRITQKWISSLHELESLKQAKLESDYTVLQEQLNPHFMFNNLSVLKSMIIYDPAKAVDFIEKFTDVYRYVLQCRDKTLVTLAQELDHIKSYLGIHQERLGSSLKVNYSVDNELAETRVPALALQLLVENALKHNVASQAAPLEITITTGDGKVNVENNYQPKESSFSTRQGLKNLEQRYMILTGKNIRVIKSGEKFRVELPLL